MARKILKGKIYANYAFCKKGDSHPSLVYKKIKKRRRKNKKVRYEYKVVKFTSSSKRATKLEKNIDPLSNEPCYVRRKPDRVSESSFGKELVGFKLRTPNDKALVKSIQKKK